MTPFEILQSDPRDTRCRRLHAEHPDCLCERYSGASGSPGPVLSDEAVIRIIYSEQFWDAVNCVVKPAAFSEVDTCGMSVTRLNYVSDDMLQKQVQDRVEAKPDRTFIKLVKATKADINSIEFEDRRAFCCYDTPNVENPAHADVCQAHSPARKSIRADMRRKLQQKFSDHNWTQKAKTLGEPDGSAATGEDPDMQSTVTPE